MAEYKCPALVDCPRADAHEIFERPPADDHVCPQCGTKLVPARPTANGAGKSSKGQVVASKSPMVAVFAGIGLVVAAAGGWFLTRPPGPVQASAPVASPASAPASTAAAVAVASSPQDASASAAVGLAPSEQVTQALRQDGEAKLVRGDAAAAEQSANQAASNELIKLAIAKMGQGKLDAAEKDLASAREKDPRQPLAYYNMAILRLRQARVDDALKEFEACFMAGFTHFKEMDQDPDLALIRKDPRFADLVARYRGGAK